MHNYHPSPDSRERHSSWVILLGWHSVQHDIDCNQEETLRVFPVKDPPLCPLCPNHSTLVSSGGDSPYRGGDVSKNSDLCCKASRSFKRFLVNCLVHEVILFPNPDWLRLTSDSFNSEWWKWRMWGWRTQGSLEKTKKKIECIKRHKLNNNQKQIISN